MEEKATDYWKKCFNKGKYMGRKKKEDHKSKLKGLFRRKKE